MPNEHSILLRLRASAPSQRVLFSPKLPSFFSNSILYSVIGSPLEVAEAKNFSVIEVDY